MVYEKAYVKWYFKQHRRILITYLIVLISMIVLPQLLFPYRVLEDHDVPLMISCYIVFYLNMLLAAIIPIFQFRYLMHKRSVDMYVPLPMKKTTIFWLNYGIGAVLTILPELLFFLNTVWEKAAHDYIGLYVFVTAILALAALSMYAAVTFFVIKCNSLFDACFAAGAVLMIQLLLVNALNGLLNDVVESVLQGGGSAGEFFPMNYWESMQPIVAGFTWLSSLEIAFFEASLYGGDYLSEWFAISTLRIPMLIYYLLMCTGFSFAACFAYQKRKSEDSEQKTTSKLIYPLFIALITGTLLIYNTMDIGFFWFTVVLFFLMNAMAERKLRIHPKAMIALVIYVIALFAISSILTKTNGFGRIHEYYEPSEIRAVQIELYQIPTDASNTLEFDENALLVQEYQRDVGLIDRTVRLHHHALESYHPEEDRESYASLTIHYELNNGTYANRYITLQKEDEAMIQELKDYINRQAYDGKR